MERSQVGSQAPFWYSSDPFVMVVTKYTLDKRLTFSSFPLRGPPCYPWPYQTAVTASFLLLPPEGNKVSWPKCLH